jgi:FAD/FMN-containing dehydrogenase
MRVADGRILECSRVAESDLFRATIGGMGLTGHILEVECRLARVPTPWIYAETERIEDIDRYIDALKEAGPRWPYTMGWIDCLSRGRHLGRGILYRGRWAEPGEAPAELPRPLVRPSLPFDFPEWALNRLSVRAFNALYYRKQVRRLRRGIVHPEAFFYPLDAIGRWNRMYGRRGFTQYQCVLPESAGRGAARRFLERLTARGGASMLCVIKDCGEQGLGLLSFPMRGISIALDIPVRDDTAELVDWLNERVVAEGGRVYLAKDQFTRAEHFRAMEPRLERFLCVRRKWDPEGRIRSAQSVRLLGDAP